MAPQMRKSLCLVHDLMKIVQYSSLGLKLIVSFYVCPLTHKVPFCLIVNFFLQEHHLFPNVR